ncbi:hypothetical protein ADIWIN_2724 [Winogradskyella psychrotolerans RS-3]|uniref:TonB-dependent receptor n=1 Tax=Winogradskyella psychrotolerans RS-3 TaxID=641526 RepID=S7WZP6_9FLAO|nr:hypothetical protein [Winogradskyella psychrotolerans]EPR72224.1 hypothetical protein ADIWIN_2724 [Winogradskyella psychrotolerans RS-3]
MKHILYTLIIVLLVACKSKKISIDNSTSLIAYIENLSTKGFVNEDPLIILDGKPLNTVSNLDLSLPIYQNINSNSISYVEKESKSLSKLLGEVAYNGIVIIRKFTYLHAGDNSQAIYIIDDKIVTEEVFRKIDPENIISYQLLKEINLNENIFDIYKLKP